MHDVVRGVLGVLRPWLLVVTVSTLMPCPAHPRLVKGGAEGPRTPHTKADAAGVGKADPATRRFIPDQDLDPAMIESGIGDSVFTSPTASDYSLLDNLNGG